MADEKKKNIFTSIANAFTDKDEKAEAAKKAAEAEAAKKAAEAQAAKKAAEAQEAARKLAAEKAKAAQDAAAAAVVAAAEAKKAEAKKAMEELAAKAEATRKATEEKIAAIAAEQAAKAAEAAKPKFIAEHKLVGDETLSHVALKYYGSAARPFWMVIYEANKEVIGDNPGIVRPGTVLQIPELPQELKDQLKK